MIDEKKQGWQDVDNLTHAFERGHAVSLAAQLDLIRKIQEVIATGSKKEKAKALTSLRIALVAKEQIIENITQLTDSRLTGTNKRKH